MANRHQRQGPLAQRVENDGTLTCIGLIKDLQRHERRACARIGGSGDPDAIADELTRQAAEEAPNPGGRRNALAAAEWLRGTAVRYDETPNGGRTTRP